MKTLRIYGNLARLVGRRVFRIDVNTPAEAICFLVSNFPHLEPFMADKWYQVTTARCGVIDASTELHYPVPQFDEIALTPVVAGAGGSPVGRIAVGAGLIALSFAFAPGFALFGVAVRQVVFGVGASLVLGGVAQLLTPTPRLGSVDGDPAAGESYIFNQIVNVTRQGVPVPLAYGEPVCGSVVISAGLSLDESAEFG